jgi:putative membrane protein
MRTNGNSIVQIFSVPSVKTASIVFIVFYTVGIIGLCIPFSFPIFSKLIPFALLLSFAGVLLFHQPKPEIKTVVAFTIIFILSFLIEAIGVNYGFIFGEYRYGNSLGYKIFETPLIIGLNWLLLVYLSANITNRLKLKLTPSILIASLSMLGYDIILEQTAPTLDMWSWTGNIVPLRNYLAWFIIALIFHSTIRFFKIKTENKLALVLFACQVSLFLVLFIYYKIVQ